MVKNETNDVPYLEASNREQRMKRSTNLDELYYPENKEYLEVASNVVFERLRRSTDDNEVLDHTKKPNSLKKVSLFKTSRNIGKNGVKYFDGSIMHDLKNSRVRRQAPVTDKANIEDPTHKLENDDNVDEYAKTIDMEALQKQNRPADVLEYKRFMKVRILVFILYTIFVLNKKTTI